jgi:DNA-binding transcriptional regulator YdaS (Cro superfamily)
MQLAKPEIDTGHQQLKTRTTMTLEQYFQEEPHGAKQEMADFLGITATWLSLLIHGKQQASPHLAIRIEQATQGLVTKEELRGDVFLV